ncbi:TPA: RluA family pseudouridine synthase [Patescibacteria group bacterium]|uniref:Pseudouridine synthase n=1 Tax=Candidatus Gottesmanbacteria bacterium GW2011_GWA1_43_11 TaxID=1618436 RepID=A0A0G1CHQ3_9BACT|nr:MAG: Pseudouridine synthase [Candidatus Gottesmanbacteria bacterium GW2011_GWA1_43_11]HCS79473.1 RluA family pseudouridine synthase [Patescibacteria group bacterium]
MDSPVYAVLYEDDHLLVINKPSGIIVNRADTVTTETVQDWIENKFRIKNLELRITDDDFRARSGIVHRIDKETSGCLIIAKDPESFYALQAAFKARTVKKTYIALVHGFLVPESGEINAPIARLPWNRERFGVVAAGKEAHTAYSVLDYYTDDQREYYTLVKLFPTTGRTHQLRVHLKYLGFPICGDYLYAGRKQQRKDRLWCPRVFLHAAEISFPHPKRKETITVTAPVTLDLQKVLAQLKKTQPEALT